VPDDDVRSRLEKGSDDELAHRAVALAGDGRWDEALHLQRAFAADTDYFGWTVLLGETLLAAGHPGEALEALGPLELLPWSRVSHQPAAVYPCGLVARARALERLGRPSDAARELDRLLAVWSLADPDLPALAEATAMQARLRARR